MGISPVTIFNAYLLKKRETWQNIGICKIRLLGSQESTTLFSVYMKYFLNKTRLENLTAFFLLEHQF